MILVFVLGYILIAVEHIIHINKATFALLMCGILWSIYALLGHPQHLSGTLIEALGDTCEILFFLIGAMTIVELIDNYDGFSFITKHIKANNKRMLMAILALITFFLSALLDNMTTTIIIIMLLKRIIADQKERWLFACVVIFAANSGGAWSPIGDVTTIMLWMKNYVTSASLIDNLLIPCIVSAIIPVIIASRFIKNDVVTRVKQTNEGIPFSSERKKLSLFILIAGVVGLLFVPIFKSATGLPPYLGMLFSMGILWLITEILVRKYNLDKRIRGRVSSVMRNIDMSTILFFLGILMSVNALNEIGLLKGMATALDQNIHEPYLINGIIGVLSSIVDNVPLVAACMNMYDIATEASIAASVDPAYMTNFIVDGTFWHLLTYCAGVGGSLLIIGSAAGVVAMGLENISFLWYLKKFTWIAFLGYVSGIIVIWLMSLVL